LNWRLLILSRTNLHKLVKKLVILMDKQNPPKVQVETWLHLLRQNDDKELKEIGKDKLLSAFEDMQAITNYIKNHHIKYREC
jgi:hypothetical protein